MFQCICIISQLSNTNQQRMKPTLLIYTRVPFFYLLFVHILNGFAAIGQLFIHLVSKFNQSILQLSFVLSSQLPARHFQFFNVFLMFYFQRLDTPLIPLIERLREEFVCNTFSWPTLYSSNSFNKSSNRFSVCIRRLRSCAKRSSSSCRL